MMSQNLSNDVIQQFLASLYDIQSEGYKQAGNIDQYKKEMKLLLAFLLVTAVLAEQQSTLPVEEVNSNAFEFVKGFLEGIGEKGDINKLLHCIKDLEHIFAEIKEALEYLKKMKLPDIIHGLTLLFNAVREFVGMLKPCTEGFEVLKHLISEMIHPNIRKIAMHIIMHPGKFIHDITEAIACFGKHDYHCAGRHVGGLLKIMFLQGFRQRLTYHYTVIECLQCICLRIHYVQSY
eukprot:TRINITY_DN8128_c0_g1_i1.p2 TRINITY_DN8128_c0_g1~~TRINITY_DN8128_c0_g1_i1.p2  ORF type:complete len:234 (+),score=19.30 TRINITY_DN8128_c0_g1_i1:226-927(+)